MFGICLKRGLGRRKKAALVVALGLALGIAGSSQGPELQVDRSR